MTDVFGLLDKIKEVGKEIGKKAEGNEDKIAEWDNYIRDCGATLTIVNWDSNGYPAVYEPKLHLTEDGFIWVDVNIGDQYSWGEIEELLDRGYYDREDIEDVLREVLHRCYELLNDGAKWVLLCPKCHEVSDGAGWTLYFDSVEEANVVIDQESGTRDFTKSEVVDRELTRVTHQCGFETYDWDADDFAVLVKDKKVLEVGGYWKTFWDEFKEIAKEKGWEVSK